MTIDAQARGKLRLELPPVPSLRHRPFQSALIPESGPSHARSDNYIEKK
ncbi:hypothetical protein R1A27_17285 [Methylobacterium sp. NMS12]